MPCRSSTSTSSTRRPLAASAIARAAATVVLPVPPLPVITCSRARRQAAVHTAVSAAGLTVAVPGRLLAMPGLPCRRHGAGRLIARDAAAPGLIG